MQYADKKLLKTAEIRGFCLSYSLDLCVSFGMLCVVKNDKKEVKTRGNEMTTLQINKQWGFYGTVKNIMRTKKATQEIWGTMVKQIAQLYPEYSIDMIHNMLNSPVGRHMADDVLDFSHKPLPAVVCLRIHQMNRLSLAHWWAYYKHARTPMPEIDRKHLYRNALSNLVKHPVIREAMQDALGPVQPDLESWLDSPDTPITELQLMWNYIEKLSKGLTNDNIK